MATDDWRASVGGLESGGERGATGRFVSWLRAEIQPPKERAAMIVMVSRGEKKKVMLGDVRCCVRACFLAPPSAPCLALSSEQ
jgi:hypothetical protein